MSFWKKKDEQPAISTPETPSASNPTPTPSPSKAAPVAAAATVQPQPPVANREVGSSEEELQERFGKIRSALGPGTVIQGKLSFDTPVRIDGKLSGEIFSSKALIVGSAGTVEAQIEASILVVQGTVRGNVAASERIEIANGGRLEGDVKTPVLVVEEGALFSGGCSMGGRAATASTKSETPKGESKSTNPKQVSVPVVTVADQSKVSKESAGKDAAPVGKEGASLH